MTATRPAPTAEAVEALARVLYEADGNVLFWDRADEDTRMLYRRMARAALSSDVIGDLIAEKLRLLAVEAREGDPIGNVTYTAVQVSRWLDARAAALSPTPADTEESP